MRWKEPKYDILQRNAFLDKAGIPPEKYGVNFTTKGDKRRRKWAKQRKKYGFDERETWNLDVIFAEFIYSRCKMYLKCANVDLSFYKFQYKDKEYTQEEAIKIVIKDMFYFIKHKWDCDEKEEIAFEKYKEACEIWALIAPAMWW